jgi:hypothetical protein
MPGQGNGAVAPGAKSPLSNPLAEARRLVGAAAEQGLTVRVLGGVAVCLQSPSAGPLLPRTCGDIDLATRRDGRQGMASLLKSAGYAEDEMFNALHGSRRLLFYDEVNERKLDVFVGQFSMCHEIPITDRLDRDPLTLPLAELMLTKLQVVELTERDQRDIYNLTFHHEVTSGGGSGIEADFVAGLCAKDWGLWRTSKATIERCQANLAGYALEAAATELITERLRTLWRHIDEAPKTTRWRLRSRVGERVRWYEEPEEEQAAGE